MYLGAYVVPYTVFLNPRAGYQAGISAFVKQY